MAFNIKEPTPEYTDYINRRVEQTEKNKGYDLRVEWYASREKVAGANVTLQTKSRNATRHNSAYREFSCRENCNT